MHFLMTGNPLDGFDVVGPFASDVDAEEYADGNVNDKFWLIQPTLPDREPLTAALMQVWDDAVAETEITDLHGDINAVSDGAKTNDERQQWYYNDVVNMFANKEIEGLSSRAAARPTPGPERCLDSDSDLWVRGEDGNYTMVGNEEHDPMDYEDLELQYGPMSLADVPGDD